MRLAIIIVFLSACNALFAGQKIKNRIIRKPLYRYYYEIKFRSDYRLGYERNDKLYSIEESEFLFKAADKKSRDLYYKVLKINKTRKSLNYREKLDKYGVRSAKSINAFIKKSKKNQQQIINAIKSYEREKIEEEQRKLKVLKNETEKLGKGFIGINFSISALPKFASYEIGLSYAQFAFPQHKHLNLGLLLELNYNSINCAKQYTSFNFSQSYLSFKPQLLITLWGIGPSYRVFFAGGPIVKIRLNTYETYIDKGIYEDDIINNFRTIIFGGTFKFGYMGISEKGLMFMVFFVLNATQKHFKVPNLSNTFEYNFSMGLYFNFMFKLF